MNTKERVNKNRPIEDYVLKILKEKNVYSELTDLRDNKDFWNNDIDGRGLINGTDNLEHFDIKTDFVIGTIKKEAVLNNVSFELLRIYYDKRFDGKSVIEGSLYRTSSDVFYVYAVHQYKIYALNINYIKSVISKLLEKKEILPIIKSYNKNYASILALIDLKHFDTSSNNIKVITLDNDNEQSKHFLRVHCKNTVCSHD